MVTPDVKRAAVVHACAAHGVSQRRACTALAVDRSTARYVTRRGDDAELRAAIRQVAAERRRFGYRRIEVMLARRGITMNQKKLPRLYREEISDLAAEGCTYLQLDDTALPCNCDAGARRDVAARGEDADELTERYARLFNDCVSARPPGMTVVVHLCRGNLKGAWMAEGGYDPIADVLFNQVNVDGYFLEYDTDRAGDFKPLRFVPKGKTVVLGLITTKAPQLESEDELLRRIEEAAKYVPAENLAVSTQCGFASAASGNLLSWDDMRRKLELVTQVARRAWG